MQRDGTVVVGLFWNGHYFKLLEASTLEAVYMLPSCSDNFSKDVTGAIPAAADLAETLLGPTDFNTSRETRISQIWSSLQIRVSGRFSENCMEWKSSSFSMVCGAEPFQHSSNLSIYPFA